MTDCAIRVATPDDAAALQYLADTSLGYAYPLEATRQRLEDLCQDDRQILFVALQQGKVIGVVHASYYYSFYGQPAYNVMALAVDASHQGQGVGRQLMTALEQAVCAQGVGMIRLNSGSHRHGAHDFYQSIGYTYTKDQKTFTKNL